MEDRREAHEPVDTVGEPCSPIAHFAFERPCEESAGEQGEDRDSKGFERIHLATVLTASDSTVG